MAVEDADLAEAQALLDMLEDDTPTAPLTRRARRAAAHGDSFSETAEPHTIVEPVTDPVAPVSPTGDAFAAAAQLFRSVSSPSKSDAASAAPRPRITAAPTPPPAPRRSRRRLLAVGSSAAVMTIAGLLAVSLTLPSEAVAAAQGHKAFSSIVVPGALGSAPVIDEDEIQAFVASDDLSIQELDRSASSYSAVSLGQLAAASGITIYSTSLFTNDPDAAIQWPFKYGVPMSSPYGPRRGRMHEGIDLAPGNGAPIQAVADGTVRVASEAGGNYGVHVWIDHVIDGQRVSTHYAHMQYGSLRVRSGQQITVGTVLGKTGNTGRSNGPHLHFEVSVGGVKINPLPWLRKNTGRYDH